MKGKYICLRYFLLLTLSFILFLNIPLLGYCSGTGYSRGLIYDTNSRNAQVIKQFNNMSDAERQELVGTLFPIISKKLGFNALDPYSKCNETYLKMLHARQLQYVDAEDYYMNSGDLQKNMFCAYTGEYYNWYEDLADYLATVIVTSDEENLYVNDTTPIYYIINQTISDEAEENGYINALMFSYNNINADQFYNLSLYSDFIRLCKEYNNLGRGYVYIMKNTANNRKIEYVMFADKKPNIYNNGTTLGNTIQLIDDNGNYTFTFDIYKNANEGATHFDKISENSKLRNLQLGNVTVPSGNVDGIVNGWKVDGFGIYTLLPEKTNYYLSTSLSGWINSQGHYEPTYQLSPYFGNVPTVTITSNNMTTYYIQNYTDNSSGDTIYYPPNYDPNDNGYDETDKTLKFNGITEFLASLGNLLGSLINGIAQGLANLIQSLTSIINNLRNNLMQGVIFEFLSTFMGWLPIEIVSLLTALFGVTVIFALIKLLKGFF